MKNLLFFISIILFSSSCKKEEQYNPDEHITYDHWYKLNNRSGDTLYSVYFANAFTPNRDGINDVFKPIGNYSLNRFVVYNRLGDVIYKTTDPSKSWDGKISGSAEIVQMGIYTYQLMVSDINGENYEYTGAVMLYK